MRLSKCDFDLVLTRKRKYQDGLRVKLFNILLLCEILKISILTLDARLLYKTKVDTAAYC